MSRQALELLQQPAQGTVKQGIKIRRYTPADQVHVVDICRGVYGGSDYMPRMIKHYEQRPQTSILVSQPSAAHQQQSDTDREGDLHGVVCGHKRGSAWFIFGLRVAENARGQGVGVALSEQICRARSDYGNVRAVTSATTPQNTAAIRIFETLGFTHTHTVDVWPSYAAVRKYEEHVGFVPGSPEQPQYPTNLLDYTPGARSYVSAASSSLGVELQDWVQCSSLQELQQAVASIRQQQAQLPELQQLAPEFPSDWLPWVYETYPLDSPWVNDRIEAGEIWLLPHKSAVFSSASTNGFTSGGSSSSLARSGSMASSSSSSGGCLSYNEPLSHGSHFRAVVVITQSAEYRRQCAGVLTAADGFLPAAIEFVDSRTPHYICFCDRGSRHSSGKPDPNVVLPEFFTLTGESSCFSVYVKPMSKPAIDASEEVRDLLN